MKVTRWLVALSPLMMAACINVKTAPIEVKPVHITVDVNLRIAQELDGFFADLDKNSSTISTPAKEKSTQ